MLNFKPISDKDISTSVQFRKDAFIASFPNSDVWKQFWDEKKYCTWLKAHTLKFPLGAIHLWLNQEIIGQLEFNYGQPTSHINLFYLRPEFRGKNYSHEMHTYAINTLRQQGTQAATLRAAPTNERAICFYKKHGWQDLGADSEHKEVNRYRLDL